MQIEEYRVEENGRENSEATELGFDEPKPSGIGDGEVGIEASGHLRPRRGRHGHERGHLNEPARDQRLVDEMIDACQPRVCAHLEPVDVQENARDGHGAHVYRHGDLVHVRTRQHEYH